MPFDGGPAGGEHDSLPLHHHKSDGGMEGQGGGYGSSSTVPTVHHHPPPSPTSTSKKSVLRSAFSPLPLLRSFSSPIPQFSPATVGGLFFALGMAWCASTEYIILMRPHLLPYIYVYQIIPLLIFRCWTYYKLHWQHYTLELCYFSNILLIMYILFFPSSDWLFIVLFGLCNGPVLTANVVYRCSLVLSDLQRFITWYMHIMPAVVIFTLRWLPHDDKFEVCQGPHTCLTGTHPILLLVLPVIAFVAHAIAYNAYVWGISPPATRNHPKYENSYLYHAKKATSGALAWMLNCLGPRWRVLSFTLWTSAINFVSVMIAYLLWSSRMVNLAYLLFVIFATAFYAGSWYCYLTTKNQTNKVTIVAFMMGRRGGSNHETTSLLGGQDHRPVPEIMVSPMAAS